MRRKPDQERIFYSPSGIEQARVRRFGTRVVDACIEPGTTIMTFQDERSAMEFFTEACSHYDMTLTVTSQS